MELLHGSYIGSPDDEIRRIRRPRRRMFSSIPAAPVSAPRLDRWSTERGVRLLRPSYRNRTPRPDEHLLKPVRQLIESVNDTLKGQLDLELHGGRSIEGVGARVAQRLLAMTAAIWHNRATGQTVTRSLIAYDH